MNIIFCSGVMPPEMDWKNREFYPGNWEHWLQFRIEKDHDIIMQIPKFPHAHSMLMKYGEWERIMDFQDINSETILIGHSAGGGFILKYMAKHPEFKVRKIVLVAPWIDPDSFQPNDFYKDFDLNDSIVNQTKYGIDMMVSSDDMPDIVASTNKIMKDIPSIRLHNFEDRGHFIEPELPEILDIIKY